MLVPVHSRPDPINPKFVLWCLTVGQSAYAQIYIGNGRAIEAHINDGFDVHYCAPRIGGDVFRLSTSSEIKQAAVDWVTTKLGLPYDIWLVDKQVHGNSYYCSELIWAAYLDCGGPDIDQNEGWCWPYFNGVAPAELADDDNTYYVGTI